jgi:hypothetical protein
MNTREATAEEIARLVEKAEAAVKAIHNPELQKVAFSKVLDSMLGPAAPTPAATNATSRTKSQPATPRKRSKSGPSAYLEELHADGFFQRPVGLGDVRQELRNRGHHIPVTTLSGPMQTLCKRKVLRRQKSLVNGKEAFVYSNW